MSVINISTEELRKMKVKSRNKLGSDRNMIKDLYILRI